jgi:hypothetical protein
MYGLSFSRLDTVKLIKTKLLSDPAKLQLLKNKKLDLIESRSRIQFTNWCLIDQKIHTCEHD